MFFFIGLYVCMCAHTLQIELPKMRKNIWKKTAKIFRKSNKIQMNMILLLMIFIIFILRLQIHAGFHITSIDTSNDSQNKANNKNSG